MTKTFKPGQAVPKSGQYEKIGPRGGQTRKEVTGVKGKTFPPAAQSGITYRLADITKHKRPSS
ncbi:MAG: YjzC family protein [Candidatus Uhrbacteria bacterium]|nr:YjzC family protein [Candidatus Uhrbacteria bacterium]